MTSFYLFPDSRALPCGVAGHARAMESDMLIPDTYESRAYALGFDHARAGVERPIRGQCCPAYWLGYQMGVAA